MKFYNVNISEKEKALVFQILEKHDSYKGLTNFCDSLSNLIKGEVSKANLLDMFNCITLIDESFESEFQKLIDKVSDDLYKKHVIKS